VAALVALRGLKRGVQEDAETAVTDRDPDRMATRPGGRS
jgi:hypothetical protein